MYVLEIPILNYYFYLTQRHNPWVREQIDMRKNIVKTLKNAALQTIYISGFSEMYHQNCPEYTPGPVIGSRGPSSNYYLQMGPI